MPERERLKACLDVKIRADGFLGVDPFGEVDANETVHEGRADPCPAQRATRMGKVRSRASPADVAENNFAEADRPCTELEAGHPERVTNCRARTLSTNR